MKLSCLYSNKPDLFRPIHFNRGLNVVLAEIRLPENKSKDTHNLGKTLLGRLIDFAFISQARDFVLLHHAKLFAGFVFFLEVELADGSFVTIRRGIDEPTKVSFKRHGQGRRSLSRSSVEDWDHADVPFEKARMILDGLLDWRALKPWDYRKEIGYLLRSQLDYGQVVQLGKFVGAHSDWKPFVAHILGFNAILLRDLYSKEKLHKEKDNHLSVLRRELSIPSDDVGKIDGMLLLKRRDADKLDAFLAHYDFAEKDSADNRDLVNRIDRDISALNAQRYSLTHSRRKIQVSIEGDEILFSPDDASKLFREAGILFEGQIKKDFKQLVDFNKAITEERRAYLLEEREEIDARLREIAGELEARGRERSATMDFLTTTDSMHKFRSMAAELVTLKADIAVLERQRDSLHRITELRAEIRTIIDEKNQIRTEIEANLETTSADHGSLFSRIRLYFSEVVEAVLSKKALLGVRPNKAGHLEFYADILDEGGDATSAKEGTTYRKLLCIAFDLAVLKAHLPVRFPRFAFHDGALEALDDRKKENLLELLRSYGDLGIQCIITTIDSDLPSTVSDDFVPIQDDEIVLRLHDEGDEGRLFKMPSW